MQMYIDECIEAGEGIASVTVFVFVFCVVFFLKRGIRHIDSHTPSEGGCCNAKSLIIIVICVLCFAENVLL